jgi:hypothetical protein
MRYVLRFAAATVALLIAGMAVSAASADTNTNTNSQTGSNAATTTQSAAAVSGDATATNISTAYSGSAVATAYLSTFQGIFQKAANQVAVGADACECFGSVEGDDTNTNTNSQTGDNALTKAQQAAAASGAATADLGSEATSGEVAAMLEEIEKQIIAQKSINQGLFPDMGDEAAAPPEEEAP